MCMTGLSRTDRRFTLPDEKYKTKILIPKRLANVVYEMYNYVTVKAEHYSGEKQALRKGDLICRNMFVNHVVMSMILL